MAVIKEFWCPAHGDFDSPTPTCPQGCSVGVERHFRTPPGLAFGVARRTDHLLEGIAKSHGLSDMDNRGGRPARALTTNDKMRVMRESIEQRYGKTGWGAVAPGKTYEPGIGVKDNGVNGNGALQTIGQMAPSAPAADVRSILADVPKPPVHRIVDRRDPGGAAGIAQIHKAAA